ncbi:resolvase [Sedimentitalea sp. CY04]|uniref:Resolvase n=1 Tax=Parasedimentitalea denitrificans TaxID=2211118 RepID=A0ABX0WFT1_9RHOB|nr:recombinase family protein [Sedimentitalea sp. CY04]NIZ63537.1 resolvase [Sedimentitalea sp. CY04]
MYEEKVSAGGRTERMELTHLRRRIEPGDEIHIYSIDRLARSLSDLTSIVDEMVDKGATVHFLKENLTFSSDKQDFAGKLMMQVLGAIAEFERSLIRQRQREGIEKAKSAGKYKGKPRTIDREAIIKMLSAGVSPSQIAKLANIGVATVYRIRKEYAEISQRTTA